MRPLQVAMAACSLLITPIAHGNPADAFGLGARIPAMGGAGTATSDDTSAGYYNPAALGLLNHVRLDIGYQYVRPSLEINNRDLGVDTSRGIATGAAIPGRIGPIKLALAGTFFFPDRYFARTRALQGDQPRFQLYDNRPQRFLLSANIAASYGDWLAVGGGITYMSGTNGDVNLGGRVGFPDASDSDLALAIDMDVETVAYPQAGVWARPTDWLVIGATYRGEFKLELNQVVDIRGSVGADGIDPVVDDGFFTVVSAAQDLFQPAQFMLGGAIQIGSDWLVTAELGYHRWSAFDNPATLIDIALDVGVFNDEIDIAEPEPYPAARFDDILVPRIGAEWTAMDEHKLRLDVRSGYAYEPSPAPTQRGSSNFVDNDKHTFSVGAGATLKHWTEIIPLPFSIDMYAAMSVLPERLHKKDSPTDPVGDYRSDGVVLQLGLGSRWMF